MDCQYNEEKWKRPFTNKRYLHPPFSENICTMWPDMRILHSDVIEKDRGHISSGFRILVGDKLSVPDFAKVQYETREDGVPIHAIRHTVGDYSIRMESFCDTSRSSTIYTEIQITNNTDHPVSDIIAVMPRSGNENNLMSIQKDGYAHYNANVHIWGMLTSNWRLEGNLLTDGEYGIRIQLGDSFTPVWQGDVNGLVWYQRYILKLPFTVLPGQRISFTCSMRHGAAEAFDYYVKRSKTLRFWHGELSRIQKFPGGGQYHDIVNNVVAQSLQMFTCPMGEEYVQARQGGMERNIWPCEAFELLNALDRLGGFYDYTEAVYETYFFTLQVKEGEQQGSIVKKMSTWSWGSMTGGSCYGCATHLLYRDAKESFDKFADALYLSFQWMQRQRALTLGGDYPGVGIFPSVTASDWGGNDQSTFTDCINLMGYEALAKVFEHFCDPHATEIRDAYEDYMACMRQVIANEVAKNTRDGEILLTNKIGVDMPDPPTGPYMTDGPIMLVRAGVLEPGCETIRLVENYYRNRQMMRNGLTGLMNDGQVGGGWYPDDPWAGHTWYTSQGDYAWFMNWLQSGEREKAALTLFAQMQWGMTPEYYLLERYADNDPYWTPWLPNASANGRLLMMMMDYFG